MTTAWREKEVAGAPAGARRAVAICLCLALLGAAGVAGADARTEFLERMLQTSDQFRVRAQAALGLGHVRGDPTVVPSLRAALQDSHPAVRAAAAASLETVGDPSALPDLQRASNDSDASVRSAARHAATALSRLAGHAGGGGPTVPTGGGGGAPTGGGAAHYYVGVGTPGTRAGVSPSVLSGLRDVIVQAAQGVDGVRIAPPGESNSAASRAISAGHLVGFYLDSSVTTVESRPDGSLRATVSVVVQTYPGRDIKTILQGAATVMGGGSDAQEQAIEGAFRGALRSLPQALALSARD